MPRIKFIKNTVLDREDVFEGDVVDIPEEEEAKAILMVETYKKAVYVDGKPGDESTGPSPKNNDPKVPKTR